MSDQRDGVIIGGWQLTYADQQWVSRDVYEQQVTRIAELEEALDLGLPKDWHNKLRSKLAIAVEALEKADPNKNYPLVQEALAKIEGY
jgi:hypothetical protein